MHFPHTIKFVCGKKILKNPSNPKSKISKISSFMFKSVIMTNVSGCGRDHSIPPKSSKILQNPPILEEDVDVKVKHTSTAPPILEEPV